MLISNYIKLLFFILIISIFDNCTYPLKEKVIDIMEKDTLIDPSDEDVNTHNDFDVNVYKITFSDSINIYNVMFYRKENKLLRYYGACYGTEAAYNIAYCKWINDSTVTIKLHNSRNKKEKMFSVSGKGGTSTLIIEKTK